LFIFTLLNQIIMLHKHQAPVPPAQLKEMLRTGLVQFAFVKKDGTLRTAMGTTNLVHIPADHHPQGVREASPKVVTFWDLLSGEWRSVSINSQIFIPQAQ
jgi:hypothetical protein